MTEEFFSVITVVRNDVAGLNQTIQSVAAAYENCESLEHVVIDGDSTDGTKELLASLTPPYRFRYVSEPDKGIFDAMNKAARYISGEYVYFLNAGDVFADDSVLSRVQSALALSQSAWAFGGIRYTNVDGEVIGSYTGQPYSRRKVELGLAYVPHQASFVSRELWASLGGFRAGFGLSSDQELLLRCAADSTPQPLLFTIADMLADGAHRSTSFEERSLRYRSIRKAHNRLILGSRMVDGVYTWGVGKYWRITHAVRERAFGRPRL